MKDLKIFIVNGRPNSGKTTFEEKIIEKLTNKKCIKISIIDPICNMLNRIGINSKLKDEKMRKLKSDIKLALDNYNNYTYIQFYDFVQDIRNKKIDIDVLFCDMREYENIEQAKIDFNAVSVFVNNNNVPMINTNVADSGIEDIVYDVIIENNNTLAELDESVDTFISNFILGSEDDV